ncbi:MAG: acyl carrier protein [Bacteroidales bacterium]
MSKLEEVIKETLFLPEESEVKDEDGPGTLDDWDSMGHMNVIGAVEDEYQVEIGPEEILHIQSVSDIKKLLKTKGIKDI